MSWFAPLNITYIQGTFQQLLNTISNLKQCCLMSNVDIVMKCPIEMSIEMSNVNIGI